MTAMPVCTPASGWCLRLTTASACVNVLIVIVMKLLENSTGKLTNVHY